MLRPHPPVLLVDVDGVLSVFGYDPLFPPPGIGTLVDGLPHWFADHAATALRRLSAAFTCVWCTGWEDRADEHLPHLLGLPAGWPHLELGRTGVAHFKLDAIDLALGPDQPVAWVDDQLDPACERWAAQRPGPTLLVRTDPAVGLTADQADELLAWAGRLDAR